MKPQVLLSTIAAIVILLIATFFSLPRLAFAAPPALAPGREWRQAAQLNAAPDLTLDSITLNPANPGAGGVADITPVIKNNGDANAGGFSIHIYVDPVDNPPTATTPATAQTFFGLGLAAGGTFNGFTRTGQPFSKADWTVCAWVDRGNQVAEANESNNLICIQPPTGPGPDSYEENDVCSQAKEVKTDGTLQEHNLARTNNVSDTDWISMAGVSGVTYVAQAIATGADADLYLELHANCDGNPSFGSGAIITFTAPSSGNFYLKVAHNQPQYGPNNAYQFKVTAQNACSASFEPNDMCSAPVDLAVGGGAQTQSFCTANDTDWTRFAVKAGGKYRVQAKNVGSNANVQMSLFTSCEGVSADNGQQLEFTAAAAGFIYLKTNNLDAAVHGPNTEYTMNVELTGSDGCDEDAAEQDDALANAQTVSVDGAPQRRNICATGDVDWIKFTAQGGQIYTVETLNLADQADTVLCLHDGNGTQLRCDDDSGAGDGSRLTIENASAGDYFFKVKNTNPDAAGTRTEYDLQVITGKCKGDSLEPDNERTGAKAIATDGSLQPHNACGENDV
ncbi:MAG: pre-peptidase C-terminal domain-containing protein, partial [Chloroflexota bacterium]|nr:pre-peptidase C-terminal domain-containing protein [Chloroflexota bacterium]